MPEERLRPFIVPVFIPNQGCPHRCVFCEQRRISSQTAGPVTGSQVDRALKAAIRSRKFSPLKRREVAFYGGTFTGLAAERMKELLDAVGPYISHGAFHSIRVSTRPDFLDQERLELMRSRGVGMVELGVQSMNDSVLKLSRRGHTAEDTRLAVKTLRKWGFSVGIQLMPGLPGDSRESFSKTISEIIALRPDNVRLYPALVIEGTALAKLYERDEYRPLSLVQAVDFCADACAALEKEGIPVIRVGLMSSPSLLEEGQIKAGPWHRAFGSLVRSEIYHRTIRDKLRNLHQSLQGARINIRVRSEDIPLVRGHKQEGVKRIEGDTGARVFKIRGDNSLGKGELGIDVL